MSFKSGSSVSFRAVTPPSFPAAAFAASIALVGTPDGPRPIHRAPFPGSGRWDERPAGRASRRRRGVRVESRLRPPGGDLLREAEDVEERAKAPVRPA